MADPVLEGVCLPRRGRLRAGLALSHEEQSSALISARPTRRSRAIALRCRGAALHRAEDAIHGATRRARRAPSTECSG